MTTTNTEFDERAVEAFAGRLMGLYTGGMLTYMIDIGHRTGLFSTLAAGGGTSADLAARAGLDERYVREWLGAMTTGDIVRYEPSTGVYELPAEHAVCLAGEGAMNMAPYSQLNTHLAKFVEPVAVAFREGGGVPYSAYRPEFTDVMDALGRGGFDELLIRGYVPLVPGLADALTRGARVADVACGTGHALTLLAAAFPASTFVGYDFDDGAVARARAEAAAGGLTNVSFEARDVATLSAEQTFDVVFVFDALHDQARPEDVLRAIHDALTPGGVLAMKEPCVSSNLEDNVGNPFAPIVYSVSTLHCMTVSLAQGGAGLGTAYGEQVARRMLADAGFRDVTVTPAPGDPMDALFVARRPAA